MNLLGEILDSLKKAGKSESDVRWVGNSEIFTSWEQFKNLANFDYVNEYGTTFISLGLYIVADDWWLERFDYDGKEEWKYKSAPIQPNKFVDFGCTEVRDVRNFIFEEPDSLSDEANDTCIQSLEQILNEIVSGKSEWGARLSHTDKRMMVNKFKLVIHQLKGSPHFLYLPFEQRRLFWDILYKLQNSNISSEHKQAIEHIFDVLWYL